MQDLKISMVDYKKMLHCVHEVSKDVLEENRRIFYGHSVHGHLFGQLGE